VPFTTSHVNIDSLYGSVDFKSSDGKEVIFYFSTEDVCSAGRSSCESGGRLHKSNLVLVVNVLGTNYNVPFPQPLSINFIEGAYYSTPSQKLTHTVTVDGTVVTLDITFAKTTSNKGTLSFSVSADGFSVSGTADFTWGTPVFPSGGGC